MNFFIGSLLIIVILLSACGGSKGPKDDTKTYTADASSGNGGSIRPSSLILKENTTGGFTITPDIGYVIDTVTGCSGAISTSNVNLYMTGSITADCSINVLFKLGDRVLSIAEASSVEGNNGVTILTFRVSLSSPAVGNVTANYITSDASATAGIDYTAQNGTLTITNSETSTAIQVPILGDNIVEQDEYFNMTLSAVSTNAALSTNIAKGHIKNDDLEVVTLNDTGIIFGANYPGGNNVGCTGETIAQQDCSNGFDNSNNDNSDGHAGFRYTKLDANGNALAASAMQWSCVKDNNNGRIWEVKDSLLASQSLHSSFSTYSWYNSDSYTNGGVAGIESIARNSCFNYLAGDPSRYCNTEAFVTRVNATSFCGFNDWRVPTRSELIGLTNLNRVDPSIDTLYFPNTQSDGYWTSSPIELRTSGSNPDELLVNYVHFFAGDLRVRLASGSTAVGPGLYQHLRLVRSGPVQGVPLKTTTSN